MLVFIKISTSFPRPTPPSFSFFPPPPRIQESPVQNPLQHPCIPPTHVPAGKYSPAVTQSSAAFFLNSNLPLSPLSRRKRANPAQNPEQVLLYLPSVPNISDQEPVSPDLFLPDFWFVESAEEEAGYLLVPVEGVSCHTFVL